MRQIEWDKYEVALLIESVIKISNESVIRSDELRSLSELLRKRAVKLGMHIDDEFRNYNGMTLQAAAIESLLFLDKGTRHHSHLFEEMVNLYKADLDKYKIILADAHKQSE